MVLFVTVLSLFVCCCCLMFVVAVCVSWLTMFVAVRYSCLYFLVDGACCCWLKLLFALRAVDGQG